VAHPSLLPSNRDSLSEVSQILYGECLTGCVRLLNKLFTDAVVYVPLEARLLANELPQAPAGTAGVGGLEWTAPL
jgi:hypothetical protein